MKKFYVTYEVQCRIHAYKTVQANSLEEALTMTANHRGAITAICDDYEIMSDQKVLTVGITEVDDD